MHPQRAAVRPRVRSSNSSLPLLLEDEIAELLDAGKPTEVQLTGSPGSGRRTALAHLAYVFRGDTRLQFAQEVQFAQEAHDPDEAIVRVRTASKACFALASRQPGVTGGRDTTRIVEFAMQPWSNDDVLEYLLNQHREHVGRVLSIWQADTSHDLQRWPAVCRSVLDQLAIRPELGSVRSALWITLALDINEQDYGDAVAHALTSAVGHASESQLRAPEQTTEVPRLQHLLGSETVLGTLVAQWVLEVAKLQPTGQTRLLPWSQATRDAIEHAVRTDAELASTLQRIAEKPRLRHKAFVFGALGLKQPGYRPPRALRGDLRWAWLRNADLSGFRIKAQLDFANLSDADLNDCTFEYSGLSHADLTDARANGVRLAGLQAIELTANGIRAAGSDWSRTVLQSARLQNACFDNASFDNAVIEESDLRAASLRGSLLTSARLVRVALDDADLTEANCHRMRAQHVDLRTVALDRTNLEACRLFSCNFEGSRYANLRAIGTTFVRCDLTATQWFGADLQGASFAECGLAHVDWQGADLRGVDFRTATFHLGNSRSGLVDSLIAGEGSRTGFYTDESLEGRFQTPEDVRKANLRNCDLRGAVVEGTDFYLVDLRGAQMSAAQRQWMMRCRAILDPA